MSKIKLQKGFEEQNEFAQRFKAQGNYKMFWIYSRSYLLAQAREYAKHKHRRERR